MLKPNIFISYKRGHQPTVDAVERPEGVLRNANFEILRDVNIEPAIRPMTSIGG